MVLTRRSAAAISKQRLKEKARKAEHLDTEEEGSKEESTEHEETETEPDGAPISKEDADKVEQVVEKMESDSMESLTAAACSILRRAMVDARPERVDSDDEVMEEDCMESEGPSGNFMPLSGTDLVEETSLKKKKKKKRELVAFYDIVQV